MLKSPPFIKYLYSPLKSLTISSFKKLRLDLGLRNLGDGDGAELVEALVSYLAVEDNLLRHDIGTIDVAEDSDVFRATLQRKR